MSGRVVRGLDREERTDEREAPPERELRPLKIRPLKDHPEERPEQEPEDERSEVRRTTPD